MGFGLRISERIGRLITSLIVVVPLGKSVYLELKPPQRASEALNYFDKVVEIDGTGTAFLAKGKAPGLSPVIVTGANGKKQLFLAIVPKPR